MTFPDERLFLDLTIPVSIRETDESLAAWPFRRGCIHCGHGCVEQIDGEIIHQECLDELIADQRAENRLNDPRHSPYGGRKI